MIIKAKEEDLKEILFITKQAINLMQKLNFHQWNEEYPNEKDFKQDIKNQELYVYKENDEILGFICISSKFEKEYKNIKFNKKFDDKHLILHRFAIKEKARGKNISLKILNFCEEFAIKNNKLSLRSDTYSKNFIMQKLFLKLNYNFCGKFNIKGYTNDFYAYEKILNKHKIVNIL